MIGPGPTELVILVVVLILFIRTLHSPGMRFFLGGVVLIGGLVFTSNGFLTWQQLSENTSAAGPARVLVEQLPAIETRRQSARLQIVGGVGIAATGAVLLVWGAIGGRRATPVRAE